MFYYEHFFRRNILKVRSICNLLFIVIELYFQLKSTIFIRRWIVCRKEREMRENG